MASTEVKIKRRHRRHNWMFQRQVALEYLEGTSTLKELSVKYDIPHQTISDWSKAYAGDAKPPKVSSFNVMTSEEQKAYDALKQQFDALKKDLEFAQMKARAMEIMMELAKEEYGIDIRKNSGAKQPVKSKKNIPGQK